MTDSVDKALENIRRNGRLAAVPPPPSFTDLVPDPSTDTSRSHEELNIDRRLKEYPIDQAYVRWIDKGAPRLSGRDESNMVRCPRPDHTDSVPSAWMNLKLNVGTCGVCRGPRGQWGFDPFDLYAIKAGCNVDTYKTDGSFPELRRAMAEELGFRIVRSAAGRELAVEIEPEPINPDNPDKPPVEAQEPPEARHLHVVPPDPSEDDTDTQDEFSGGPIDWRAMLGADSTFLRDWMNVCTSDDLPEEFYFWLGLMAIGLACGNDYVLADRHPVRGNLMVCLVGKPGLGKSRSIYALEDLMRHAFPYRTTGASSGVRLIPDAGSGEALVDCFVAKDEDGQPVPVRGLLVVEELASVVSKAARNGNTMKTTMQSFYDKTSPVSITSRGAKDVTASQHFCSIVSTTQPKLVGDLMSREDANSGFVSRWVFISGTMKPLISYGGKPLDVEPLRKQIADIKSFAAKGRQIGLDDEATPMWETFFRTELEPMKLGDAAVFARIDLLLKKLLVLFAADKQKAYVGLSTMQQVIALWPYLKKTYGLVEKETSRPAKQRERATIEDRILRVIARMERLTPDAGRTTGYIWRGLGKRDGLDRESFNLAMKTLELSGAIEIFARPAEKSGLGRPRGAEYRITR